MIRDSQQSDNTLLRLFFVSAVALFLAGLALIVSANTQVSKGAYSVGTQPLPILRKLPLESDTAFNASRLLTLGAHPTAVTPEQAEAEQQANAQRQGVNVNTFLLSQRVTNDSQLAILQMQPFFVEFDSRVFLSKSADVGSIGEQLDNALHTNTDVRSLAQSLPVVSAFAGVGFPHIESNDRPAAHRYKPYKQLLSFSEDNSGSIVPHIKCMGLSPERVANRAKKYDAKIFELAVQHNVSASLVKAVVAKESCFNASARSHAGAIGLMQLMPETAKWLKVKQPHNPQQNLSAGVRYLAQLRKRFGSNELALAAYNAGPGNVERYAGIPPFAETQNYVHDVMYFYRGYVATTRFVNAQYNFD